jgi:phosphoribosylformylglycinamidine synthase
LYNESQGTAIFPTPIVGGLGLVGDVDRHCGAGLPEDGLAVVLVGASELSAHASDLAGSEYLNTIHGLVKGRPRIDLALERRVQGFCRSLIADGLAKSAHDCSDGGLAVALAECCILGDGRIGGAGSVGFVGSDEFTNGVPTRWDATLFGEAPSRIVVTLEPEHLPNVMESAAAAGVPTATLGKTGGRQLRLGSQIDLPVEELAGAWYGGLSIALQ